VGTALTGNKKRGEWVAAATGEWIMGVTWVRRRKWVVIHLRVDAKLSLRMGNWMANNSRSSGSSISISRIYRIPKVAKAAPPGEQVSYECLINYSQFIRHSFAW